MIVKINVRKFYLLLILVIVSACAAPDAGVQVHDPFEATNRKVHDVNLAVDQAVVRPIAKFYGRIVPDKPAGMINDFASNFAEPRNVINSVLQGRLDIAAKSALRFTLNTTIGIGGLFDPAETMGIEGQYTDFGETMYVWGLNEGAYVELPFVGPSTVRHSVGRVADLFMNPLSYVLPVPEAYIGTASSLLWALDTRDEFSITVDDILYNSADSYAQARILYLQNRRFTLGDTTAEDEFDPFKELGFE